MKMIEQNSLRELKASDGKSDCFATTICYKEARKPKKTRVKIIRNDLILCNLMEDTTLNRTEWRHEWRHKIYINYRNHLGNKA